MLALMCCLWLQDLSFDRKLSWEDAAAPWMTAEEARLYAQLDDVDKARFRGAFTARRQEDPSVWTGAGIFLPELMSKRSFGDIRDQLRFALGEPDSTEPLLQNPKLPGLWVFGDKRFTFAPAEGGKVRLTRASEPVWEAVKQSRIKQPDIKYRLGYNNFGRTRLLDDKVWVDTQVKHSWWTPDPSGALVHLEVQIPPAFREALRTQTYTRPTLDLELLVKPEAPGGGVLLGTDDQVFHAGARYVIGEPSVHFQIHLPHGYYQTQLQIYSGRFETAMNAPLKLNIRPDSLPVISDPIVSYEYRKAPITHAPSHLIEHKGTLYTPSRELRSDVPGRVLVFSPHERTTCLVQNASTPGMALRLVERGDGVFVFELPAQKGEYRLMSIGVPADGGDLMALGAVGPAFGRQDLIPFTQNGAANYLALETLDVKSPGPETFLFVNGAALAATKGGSFPWPAVDWGELADVRFEYQKGSTWFGADYQLRRNTVFQRLQVKPRYLVAAGRDAAGRPMASTMTVSLVGQPAKIITSTPIKDMPRVFGLVFNDTLLRAPVWPRVREALVDWMKEQLLPEDMVYIVQSSERPELILPPTTHKALVLSELKALKARAEMQNYFTVDYLIDAIMQMPLHDKRPHQVLMFTNRLTDEINQMENLIPRLRATGLQLYNLEFPSIEDLAADEDLKAVKRKPMQIMRDEAEADERNNMNMRDNFMETRSTPGLLKWQFGNKKADRQNREDRIRLEAFHNSFNQQLASLTAGMAVAVGKGEESTALKRFFSDLTLWQESLVHLQLNAPYMEADMVDVRAGEGVIPSWTLVSWRPDGSGP